MPCEELDPELCSCKNSAWTIYLAPALCMQISHLSNMDDQKRLSLLKEIGGSKVYEDRRTESLKVLKDAEGRAQQIAELVRLPSIKPVHAL